MVYTLSLIEADSITTIILQVLLPLLLAWRKYYRVTFLQYSSKIKILPNTSLFTLFLIEQGG